MGVIVRIIGAADGKTRTPHDGKFVVAWNPHTMAGFLDVISTTDWKKAKVFKDTAEVFKEWRAVSKKQPLRPWDKLPNKPLTGVSLDIMPDDKYYEPIGVKE